MQDAAYLVMVPHICPETPALRTNPVFVYFEDHFQLPNPFEPDVVVRIDDVWRDKLRAMDAHASQFYEWLPWIDGKLNDVPSDPAARLEWLGRTWARPMSAAVQQAARVRYPQQEVAKAEAFQLCEYGRQPSRAELDGMFPC